MYRSKKLHSIKDINKIMEMEHNKKETGLNSPNNNRSKESKMHGQTCFIKFRISIIDDGVGMSEEGVKKLFVNFAKLQENAHMNRSGTGLGLSICKNIIEKMGGNVNVTSKLGIGTTFHLNLSTKCVVQGTQIVPAMVKHRSSEENEPRRNSFNCFIKQFGSELMMLIKQEIKQPFACIPPKD